MKNNTGYGVVYTPTSLSDYVAYLLIEQYKQDRKHNAPTNNITILDPACGEGALLAACERSVSTVLGHTIVHYVGIDIDENAIQCNKKTYKKRNYSYYSCDALLPLAGKKPADYWKENGVEPDLIISNPPWSSEKIYSKAELAQAGYTFDEGQYDSYVLFMELCLKLLKPDGYAAFIIPDSVFSGENKELRKCLSTHTQICVIARLGEKLFAGVNRATTVLILKNTPPSDEAETVCFRLTTEQRRSYLSGEQSLIESHKQHSHRVLQRRFTENPGFIFDVDTKKNEEWSAIM